MVANKSNRKDTVPPQKSITRGKVQNKPKSPVLQKQANFQASKEAAPTSKARPNNALVKTSAGPRLPSAGVSKGLSLKMPNVPKGDVGSQIHKRLKAKSPWYQSINDPLHGADAKIPDDTGVETGTIQCVTRASFTTNSSGVGGCKIISPYVNSVSPTGQLVPGQNFQFVNPTGTLTTVSWGAANALAGWTAGLGFPFSGIQELQSAADSHRIVSCEMIVQPEAALADNQGEYTLFVQPFRNQTSSLYQDYMNSYKAVTVPVSSNTPSAVKWFPFTREDFTFKSFWNLIGTALQEDDDGDADVQVCPFWNLGVLTSGCASGVTFRITMIVNYEFIPLTNVLNLLDTSPSPVDQQEVDLVEGWVQDMPVAQPISLKQASSSPETVTPQHGENDQGTGFGMVFNVIKELAPLALALI